MSTLMTDLLTPREAAAELKISVKSLRALVSAGALRYVQIGLSKRRPRKMFTPGDLETFVADSDPSFLQ
jgi:excisionase family DNA binding protein